MVKAMIKGAFVHGWPTEKEKERDRQRRFSFTDGRPIDWTNWMIPDVKARRERKQGYAQHLGWKRGYTFSRAIWILFRSFDGSEIVPGGGKLAIRITRSSNPQNESSRWKNKKKREREREREMMVCRRESLAYVSDETRMKCERGEWREEK